MKITGDELPDESGRLMRAQCPGCGACDLTGDDFCHECGYAFDHFASSEGGGRGIACPTCATGELIDLEYGRTQCDSCGYTTRDEG